MSVGELAALITAALELVQLLRAGDVSRAERKAKALAQAIKLKRSTRAAAAAAAARRGQQPR